jgi:hypothetical protein
MNCKPGDLAYVVRGMQRGVVVLVEHADIPYEDGSPAWKASSKTPVATQNRISRVKSMSTRFRVRDSWLRPISGVPVTEDVEDEVPA